MEKFSSDSGMSRSHDYAQQGPPGFPRGISDPRIIGNLPKIAEEFNNH
jgi:hypothetical protein